MPVPRGLCCHVVCAATWPQLLSASLPGGRSHLQRPSMADQTTLDGETKVQHMEEQATATDPSVSVFVDHVMRRVRRPRSCARATSRRCHWLNAPTTACVDGSPKTSRTNSTSRAAPLRCHGKRRRRHLVGPRGHSLDLDPMRENPHGHAGLDAMIQRIKACASGSVDPFVEDVDLARDRGPEHSDQCLVCVSTCREVAQILRYVLPCVACDTAIVFSVKERPGRPVNVTIAIPSKRRRVAEVNETGKTACPPDE